MNGFYERAIDSDGRAGVKIFKQTAYRRAWYHGGKQLWDPDEYGEVGLNIEAKFFRSKKIDFVILVVEDESKEYFFDMIDIKSFIEKHPGAVCLKMFSRDDKERYLFPTSLSK